MSHLEYNPVAVTVFSGCDDIIDGNCIGGENNNYNMEDFDFNVNFNAGYDYYIVVSTANRDYYYTSFTLTISNEFLSLEDPTFDGFQYYPNPVDNLIKLKSKHPIDDVRVLNMLGQQVARHTPNTSQAEIDMTDLDSGIYFLKISIGNAFKSIRIIKK